MVIDLSIKPTERRYPLSYIEKVPSGGWTDEYKTDKLVLRKIERGTFMMGSPEHELGRKDDEPRHKVTLNRDFYIGVFEVTQWQWVKVMGSLPLGVNGDEFRDTRPCECVFFPDVRGHLSAAEKPGVRIMSHNSFIRRLGSYIGRSVDLPTEAQWEYACRAGTETAINNGKELTDTNSCPNMSEVALYKYNGRIKNSRSSNIADASAPVGSFLPNAWGLYDMHGNVPEWCLDRYGSYPGFEDKSDDASSGLYCVVRGGGWRHNACACRSSARDKFHTEVISNTSIIGFRIVVDLR